MGIKQSSRSMNIYRYTSTPKHRAQNGDGRGGSEGSEVRQVSELSMQCKSEVVRMCGNVKERVYVGVQSRQQCSRAE